MSRKQDTLDRLTPIFEPPERAYERFLRRNRRRQRNRKLGAIALVAAIMGVSLGVGLRSLNRNDLMPMDRTPSPSSTEDSRPWQIGDTPYVVNMRTGKATALPESVTRDQGGNYRLSPDGSKLLFQRPGFGGAYGGHEDIPTGQLFVANIDGTKVRQLTDDPEGAKVGSWSPDGTQIVYVGRWSDGADHYEAVETFVLDLTTGETTRVTADVTHRPHEWFFSADGQSILFYGRSRAGGNIVLWSVPLGGGSPTTTLGREGTLSPDGTMILLSLPGDIVRMGGMPGQALWLANTDGSDRRKVWQDNDLNFGNALWSPDGSRIAVSDGGVFLIDVATGDPTTIGSGPAEVPGHVVAWLDDETLIVETLVPYD